MKIFERHVSRQLSAHIDGELGASNAQALEGHLERCERCRAEREQIRFGIAVLDDLPAAHAPDAIWTAIEAALPYERAAAPPRFHSWRPAFAAVAIAVVAVGAYWAIAHRPSPQWEVVRTQGAPVVGANRLRGVARIGAGTRIETDSSSRATVKVGEIGSVEVAPNTRLLVVTARPGEHRLSLAKGEIHAKISAPPRLFFVETASGTAVDLGCEYSLHTDEDGSGVLQVTRGWVSFQWKERESLVPAGASCRTWPHAGPGVPAFDDASEKLKEALDGFDAPASRSASLAVILTEARARDTLTLWHLLSRVDVPERARVYDRIAALTPVPAGILREKALALDPDTLRRWKDELAWTW